MCGRLFSNIDFSEVAGQFNLRLTSKTKSLSRFESYNIGPKTMIPVITSTKKLSLKKWGVTINENFVINARLEEFFLKKSFQKMKKCVLACSGFFEWDSKKRPFCFTNSERKIFLAGLKGEEGVVIMVKGSYEPLSLVTSRMPHVLESKEHIEKWLSRPIEPEFLSGELEVPPKNSIIFFEVSTEVNNVKNDNPKLILPMSQYIAENGIEKFFKKPVKIVKKEDKASKKSDDVSKCLSGKESEKVNSERKSEVKLDCFGEPISKSKSKSFNRNQKDSQQELEANLEEELRFMMETESLFNSRMSYESKNIEKTKETKLGKSSDYFESLKDLKANKDEVNSKDGSLVERSKQN